MHRLLLILLIGIAGGLSGAFVPYDTQIVQGINVEIVGVVPDSRADMSVRSRMQTRVGSPFSQFIFDSDLKSLAQEYDWVEPQVSSTGDGIYINLQVWPKPLIRQITFRGNRQVKSSELQGELGIESCTVFDRASFNRAFHQLKGFYIKKGFFEVELDYKVIRDDSCNEVEVVIMIKEGRSGRIKDICFYGFDADEMNDILDLMVTKSWNIVTGVFSEGGNYNEDMIQYDQYQALNYLQNRGYADAKVKIEVTEADRPYWINVHISCCKGIQYRFGEITYEGNCIYDDKLVDKLIMAEEGRPFSPDAMRDSLKNIQDAYGAKGYIEAIVDDELTLDPVEPVYKLHLIIEEGEQYHVGLIKVFGNNYTQNRVILHETLLCPGEVFNTIKLRYTEERLRNIGYFKTVNVYAVRSSHNSCLGDNYRDVHIEVEEDSTGNFGAFMGFSTGDDIFGGFNITEKNFNIMGIKDIGEVGPRALKGGGEYAHFTATFGQKTNSFVTSWTKPYFYDTPWAVGVDLERSWNAAIARSYEIIAYSAATHAKRCLNAFLSFGWHYRIRDSRVHVKHGAGDTSPQLEAASKKAGVTSATGFSVIYNSTNHPLRPSCGLRSRVDGEFVGLGGDSHFFSFGYTNSAYHPFGENGILKLRADCKFIQPLQSSPPGVSPIVTIPIDERLFLGGDYNIRGYRPWDLGPQFKGTTDPRGGLSLILLSVEYTKPILMPVAEGFVFADAGYLTDLTWHVNTDDLKCSVGFGVKLNLMGAAPPVVLGYGFPLNPDNRSQIKRFFISMGAKF